MSKKNFILLIILLVVFGFLIFSFRKTEKVEAASTVGTSTLWGATRFATQRKSFYANGLFWVFYSDGTNMVYSTSTDGLMWSGATSIRPADGGRNFSVWFDGTYFHYASAPSTGAPNTSLSYRRGTPNSNGTITWSAPEQTVATANNKAYFPFVSVDSSGYIWIGYFENIGSNYYPFVIKSGNNNGTWGVTPSGFPYQLSAISDTWIVSIIPLTAGKMLAIYARTINPLIARRWDGSTWGAEKATINPTRQPTSYSAVAEGDDVHLLINTENTESNILYTKYTYLSDSWGTETTIQAGVSLSVYQVLSRNTANNDLYAFWADYPTAGHIYYKKNVSGTWDTNPTDWITETNVDDSTLTTFYQDYGNKIGLVYTTGFPSPYLVRFEYLGLVPPPTATPTATTSVATGITSSQATLNGNIAATGGENASERGFEWDTDSGEPYANSWTESGSFGTGAFSYILTGLNPNTTYYFRAKARNSTGWGNGSELSFTTLVALIEGCTIGTSTDSYVTSLGYQWAYQRKSFYANGRYWVFYSDGNYMVWAHSTDACTWTTATKYVVMNSPSASSGGWTTPGGAYTDGGTYTYIQSDTAFETYSGYGFNIPPSAKIFTVRVRYDAWTAGNEQIRVDVSWDGGTTWSTKQVTGLTTTETPYWYDVTSATDWTPSRLSDANLRVRVDAYTVGGKSNVYLDWIPVEVTYYDPPQLVRPASTGGDFSVWFDGTYFHYVYAPRTTGEDLMYRRGTLNPDGSITWSTTEQIVYDAQYDSVAGIQERVYFPTVAVDSNGYPFITFYNFLWTPSAPCWGYCHDQILTKSSLNNGTWTTDTGFPIAYAVAVNARESIVPLTSGKMYIVYAQAESGSAGIKGRLWDGNALGLEEQVTTSNTSGYGYFSIVAKEDDVHLVFQKISTNEIIYIKRTYGVGWGSEVIVQTPATLLAPVLSVDQSTGNLYVFWAGSPTANHIYYKKNAGGTWDTLPTDWLDESTQVLTSNDTLTSWYQAWNNQIGLVYMTKLSSPYDVKFEYLGLVPGINPPTVSTSTATGVTSNQATLNGNITATGGATIDERGFEWGTTSGSYPNSWTESGTFGTGAFIHQITGLNPNTPYYFRAKAHNSADWGYAGELSFTTSPPPSPVNNVSLWAWSENIGWISFNCKDREAATGKTCVANVTDPVTQLWDYGVNIDPLTGIFSGYAWSENIGWISFNESDLAGCPTSTCQACLDFPGTGQVCDGIGDYKVSGWAKALTDGGGWSGWIRLRDTNYGLNWNSLTKEIEGWAWSDMVIGWISFNCKNQTWCSTSTYKVIANVNVNAPPSASDLQQTVQYCNVYAGVGKVNLSWTYTDPEKTGQQAYSLEVQQLIGGSWQTKVLCENVSTAGPPSGGIGTSAVLIKSTPTAQLCDLPGYVGDIEYGKSTQWRVKVQDGDGNGSDWTSWTPTPPLSIDPHAHPYCNFSWAPQPPTVDESVQFTDLSVAYGGATIIKREWTFQDGNPNTATTSNSTTTTKFTSVGSKAVTLKVTDSDNYSCTIDPPKTVNLTLPLPEWKEIPPVIWLKKFFASVFYFFQQIFNI